MAQVLAWAAIVLLVGVMFLSIRGIIRIYKEESTHEGARHGI